MPLEVPAQLACGPIHLKADDERFVHHLAFDLVLDPQSATDRDRYEAVARAVRDLLSQRWLKTQQDHEAGNVKRVYYLSMEFLLGRSLTNNVTSLCLADEVRAAAQHEGFNWDALVEAEPDAGLGNGGLGRLAACYLDSLATLQIPAIGYGLRYEFGMFRQEIKDGYQIETPDHWLSRPDPWEVARPGEAVSIDMHSAVAIRDGRLDTIPNQHTTLLGIPCDRPVVGYGGQTINTLRLWNAGTPDDFDFAAFSHGDWIGAQLHQIAAQSLTRVLYPDDSTAAGRTLRFVQEYFLVSCSLADIVRRFRHAGNDWHVLPEKVAIQLNDTHPSLAVAELMRTLVDDAGLGWEDAWDLTRATLAYTNHTLLPEALERWPVNLFERLLPRHLQIVYEINKRFLDRVQRRYPGDLGRLNRVSLIEEGGTKQVRMASLAVVGTHNTNGVARIHSDLLRTQLLSDFVDLFPNRFNNVTNGVTPRRWLLMCNPDLAKLITSAIGTGWVTQLDRLRELAPLANDSATQTAFAAAKRTAKLRFVDWLASSAGVKVDPDSMFDCQIKRIHEYKRQLLNVLHIVILYNRLRANPKALTVPRTFFLAGKAAPAYALAKLIIKLINSVAAVIDADPATSGKLKVHFLANYGVSLAERLIPASDISEQISTAGYEASGTSNMKFMMNGALTVGTRDGATIEMAEAAGEANFFLFGLTAEQVVATRRTYSARWHYDNDPETRQALDLIFNDHFSPNERGIFAPIRDLLLNRNDYYLHLADLAAYTNAQQQATATYANVALWRSKAILNVAHSGGFSSDRAIQEYARNIWKVSPFPVA